MQTRMFSTNLEVHVLMAIDVDGWCCGEWMVVLPQGLWERKRMDDTGCP